MAQSDPTPGPSPSPRIWAVGGGKGGVGKSVVASNLAVALASGGTRVVAIDLDLGAANLHTMLGVSQPARTLSTFLRSEVRNLGEALCSTSVPGLSIVSGARAQLESANPNHAQKLKLLRHVRKLEASHVVLDLGAGSAFNALDFFLAADTGVLVVTPEPTSIENAYHFLKAAFFRSLRSVAREAPVRDVLEAVLADARRRPRTPRDLVAAARERDLEAGRVLRAQARAFAPRLVVNQVATREDLRVGPEMAAACRSHLGTPAELAGVLPHDTSVSASLARRQPVLQLFPGSAFSEALVETVERLSSGVSDPREGPRDPLRALRQSPPIALHGLRDREPLPPRPRRSAADERGPAPPLDFERPGRTLRRHREHLGLSQAELSRSTCVRGVDRIEDERFHSLPPEPYVRGHVAELARALGIRQPERLAEAYVRRWRMLAAGPAPDDVPSGALGSSAAR